MHRGLVQAVRNPAGMPLGVVRCCPAGLPLGATVGLAVAGAAAAVVLAVVVVRKRRQAVQQRQDLGALGLPAAPHIGPVGSE